LHRSLLSQPRKRLTQYLSGANIWGHDDAVVHPLAVPSGGNDPRAAKISQMSGNLGLTLPQNLHEVADTDLLISHQVKQAKARIVSQRLKKTLHIERRGLSLHIFIYTS
jgi:hypothetical protein